MKAKLTREQKISIQSAYWSGMPVSRICEEYGISKTTAYYFQLSLSVGSLRVFCNQCK